MFIHHVQKYRVEARIKLYYFPHNHNNKMKYKICDNLNGLFERIENQFIYMSMCSNSEWHAIQSLVFIWMKPANKFIYYSYTFST